MAPRLPLAVALQGLAHPAARLVPAARVVVPAAPRLVAFLAAARPVVPPRLVSRAAAVRLRRLAEASRYSG